MHIFTTPPKILQISRATVGRWLLCVAACCVPLSAMADPIWHCSRSVNNNKGRNKNNKALNFNLSNANVIAIDLSNLYSLYGGEEVGMSGGTILKGCFINKRTALSDEAMEMLGLNLLTLMALSQKSSIVDNHLRSASDEEEMKLCIERNHPAVGYLSEVTETDWIAPCF